MTSPSAKASEIVNAWSKNYMDPAAKPTIKMQIEKMIEHDRHETCLRILDLIHADEKLGIHSKDLVAQHVMEVLGMKEGELV